MLIAALIGALGGRILPVKKKQRGLATVGGAAVGAFVLKDTIIGLLDQFGVYGLLDQLFAGLPGGQTPTPSPSGGQAGGGSGSVIL